MKARDLLHETNTALSSAKARSALTVLGIVIGIMAVVIMVSLITGFENWLEDNTGLGAARVITTTSSDENTPLAEDDATFLKRVISDYSEVIPEATSTVSVASQTSSSSSSSSTTTSSTTSSSSSSSSSSDDSTVSLSVIGVDSAYFDMEDTQLSSGSFYSDDAGMAIVLSEDTVEAIYGDADTNVVGQSIDIGNNTYEIVGVVESAAMTSGVSSDIAYVPYSTMCDAILGDTQVDALIGLANEDADISYVAEETEGALASRHSVDYDEDNTQSVYTASTTESSLEYLQNFTTAFDALAALVAGIALLVGGIGIMNMMLTNVTERYREIGLRKSLGARPFDIRIQFLSESVALCLTGGVIGTIAGYAGAWGLASLIGKLNSSFSGLVPVITPQLILIVFGVCAAIGVIFGYYPARRASKLNPAETLRYQ